MREKVGLVLWVTGLLLMPLAVVLGVGGGADFYAELLVFTVGLSFVLMGRSLRTPSG